MESPKPGPDAILLNNNDYLQIAGNARIRETMAEALLEGNRGPMMSAVFERPGEGERAKFESRMCDFLGFDSVFTSQSGFAANTGLISAIAGPQVPVYLDMFAHYSLWEGTMIAKCPVHAFRHNSPGHLTRLIERHGPGVIIVDSVYSGTGSVAPLEKYVKLTRHHESILVVDESHSLGTHGPQGAGMLAEGGFNDQDCEIVLTASLAKTFAGIGGITAGSKRIMEMVCNDSRPIIFSSALLPYQFAGFTETLNQIKEMDEKRNRLADRSRLLRTGLRDIGFDPGASESQIITLTIGQEKEAKRFKEYLHRNQIFGSLFCAPATPKNRAMIRFSMNSEINEQQISRLLEACKRWHKENGSIGQRVKPQAGQVRPGKRRVDEVNTG